MNRNSENPVSSAPIPIPPGRRWKEFRSQALPLIGFIGAVAAVFVIWRERIAAPTLRGRVEAAHAEVSSPQSGVISNLKVARFQKVARGEPVAVITPTDPQLPLGLLRAELDVMRMRLEPRLTQQRNATDYERLRLEWLLQKVDLATTRVNLTRAENDLKRDEQLFREKLLSEQLYDFSLKNRDQLLTEVDERAKVIADLDQSLQQLKLLGDPQAPTVGADTMLALIKAQEEKLKSAESGLEPITLLAPIEGTISAVYRQAGENVRNGDPILTVSATEPDHIVGYLRQPFTIEPEIGMPVEVRIRYPKTVQHDAEILQIGSQLEPITNSLAMIRPGAFLDMGLPVKISVPNGLRARPGELVDLIFRPQH